MASTGMTSTVVVGGGISGLLTARAAAARGETVTVLESSATTGGAVADAEVAGIELNLGAEAFSRGSGAVARLVTELGLAEQIVEPVAGRGSRVVSNAGSLPAPRGGLLGIPAHPLSREVRAVLGPLGALRAWAERFLPAGYGLREGVSIGEYVTRRMGRRVTERLVAPVIGGVHSADARTTELASVQPRLAAAVREHGSLAAAVRALRPGGGTAGTAVQSLRPTMAVLPQALTAELTAGGAEVATGTQARSLAREADGTWQIRAVGPAGERVLHADHLVLATDPQTARTLLEPVCGTLAALIPEAPASPVRLVALVLQAPALDAAPSGTGALVAPGTRAVRAKALTHATAKWEHLREAAAPLHVVRLSYGRPGEQLPAADETLVTTALADASAILGTPLTADDLRGHRIITWSRAMTQAQPGHRERLAELAQALAAEPGLELVGAWRDGTGLDALVRAADARAATSTPSPTALPDGTHR